MNTVEESAGHAGFVWATQLNRLMLNSIGIWPRAHRNAYDKFFADLRAGFVFIVLMFMGAIPAIHSLVRTWGDMMSTIDNLQYTLPLLTTIMKLVVVWWRRTDLSSIIDMIADDWTRAKTDRELRVMINRAWYGRVLTIIGYTFMFLGITLLVILPCFGMSVRYRTNITDPDRPLPLQTHYLYDKDRSPYFELTFVAQTVMVLMCGATYSGVDNLLGLLVFHLCGQMENLKERLINMRRFENFHCGLSYVVRDHIRLIRCFDVIESTFTLLLLGLLLYFGMLFCLYGFLIVAILTEGREMSMMRLVYLVSVAINICGHMCLFCAVGELLVAQCDGMHRAAYEYKWYEMRPEQARTLILVMIRSGRPLHITAGKVFPMTMSMFCNLIKTSTGYVSVLLAMRS